jgi:hypothetical protein
VFRGGGESVFSAQCSEDVPSATWIARSSALPRRQCTDRLGATSGENVTPVCDMHVSVCEMHESVCEMHVEHRYNLRYLD